MTKLYDQHNIISPKDGLMGSSTLYTVFLQYVQLKTVVTINVLTHLKLSSSLCLIHISTVTFES